MTPNKENQCCQHCWITTLADDEHVITPVSEPFCANPFCPCHTTEKVEGWTKEKIFDAISERKLTGEGISMGYRDELNLEKLAAFLLKLTNPTNTV